jgi:hypothetical protein
MNGPVRCLEPCSLPHRFEQTFRIHYATTRGRVDQSSELPTNTAEHARLTMRSPRMRCGQVSDKPDQRGLSNQCHNCRLTGKGQSLRFPFQLLVLLYRRRMMRRQHDTGVRGTLAGTCLKALIFTSRTDRACRTRAARSVLLFHLPCLKIRFCKTFRPFTDYWLLASQKHILNCTSNRFRCDRDDEVCEAPFQSFR